MLELKRAAATRLFFLASILWAAWSIYASNLSSPFILDDWPNLNPLSQIQEPSHSQEIIRFLANNRSGNDDLSRPVSLLSFALQADDWPNNPAAFKTVNLGLHLANGLLIMLLCQLLLRLSKAPEQLTKWLPLMIGGLWLIQPIHVSTVLYTVQRMTLLATIFSLLSLVGYLKGRCYCYTHLKSGYIICTLSLILGGLLAVLSKENGILLVLYIAVIEITILQNQPKPKYWRYWLFGFIFMPILLAFIYVIFHFETFVSGHAYRDYSLSEHLLTESRILIDYINKILFPRPNSFGLFFDDYPISTGILSPVNTLFSLILLVGLLLSALIFRIKQLIFSFAVLWFFAGHALESTIIPLELYFEHRNYLASLGIIFGVCYYFIHFINKASSQTVKLTFISLALIYTLGIWFVCYQEASLWGNSAQQAIVWQNNHPKSKRANALASEVWLDLKQPLKADTFLQNIPLIDPRDSASYLMRLEIHCYINHLSKEEQTAIPKLLKEKKVDNAAVLSIQGIVSNQIAENCQYLEPDYIEQILTTLLSITPPGNLLSHLSSTLSLHYAANNQYPLAFKTLDQAIEKMPEASELKLIKIRWAIANNQLDDALKWIADARKQTSRLFLRKKNYINQLDEMESDVKKAQRVKKVPATLK